MRTGGTLGAMAAPAAAVTAAAAQRSPWHSPIPYLFGGLAAMLGLIAFALLILACSYWKLSGYLESGGDGAAEGDPESGGAEAAKAVQPVYEEKILVIMAGEEKPTFLATRASSFNSEKGGPTSEEESCNHVRSGNGETRESSHQVH